MKKKLVVSLMVLLMVFAVSGSAFAKPRWERDNNFSQWGQQQNMYQSNPYQMGLDQTNSVNQFFLDVPQSNWAYNMIKEMRKRGIINGDSDGKFYPDRQVTRAEFATMLVRALNLPTNQGAAQTFSDVPASFWGFNYIEAAQNYLTGYQNANGQLTFNPQDSAVREDIIVALVRAEGLGNEQPDLTVLSNFVDANNISYNLRGYVAIAVKHGLVQGSTDQTGQYYLYPQNKLTRAEAAAFLNRILKVVVGQQSGNQQDTKVIVGQQSGSQNQQGPVLSSATVNGATLTLTYNENLDPNSVPYVSDFTVMANGMTQAAPSGITVSGSSVTLTLYQAVPSGSTVTVNYTPGVRPLRDLTGYNAAALVNYQVSNGTSGYQQAPVLSSATVNGATLTLTYNENLDSNSVPYVSDFIIRVNGIAQAAPSGITVSGSSVTLALYQAVSSGSTVTVNYTPGVRPLRDLSGYNAAALVNYQVSNGTSGYQQAPVLSSATVNGATMTLNYNENLDPNSVPYVSDFIIRVNGIAQTAPSGITVSGSSVTLALYQVVSSGSTVTVNYTPGVRPLRDLSGYNAAALVNYQVSNGTSDTISPVWPQGSALSVSNLSGTGLTLTWPQATDNVGVATYRIYQDGNLLTTVAGSVNAYNVVGLSPGTTHTFRVDAGDAVGNWTAGPSLSITTNH